MAKVNPDRVRGTLEALIELDDQLVLGIVDKLLADDYTGTNLYERIECLLKQQANGEPIPSCYLEFSYDKKDSPCPCGCGQMGRGFHTHLCGFPEEILDESHTNENPKEISDKEILELTLDQQLGITIMQFLSAKGSVAINNRMMELGRMGKLIQEIKSEKED